LAHEAVAEHNESVGGGVEDEVGDGEEPEAGLFG